MKQQFLNGVHLFLQIQLIRIELRVPEFGWTTQKVFHLMNFIVNGGMQSNCSNLAYVRVSIHLINHQATHCRACSSVWIS